MRDLPDWLTFAGLIKDYRKDVGMTLAKFGEVIGFSAAYVSDIERGSRTPSVNFVEKFIAGMNMDESEGAIWHKLGAKANGWRV
jgi:transcriptional regulator with XRE-family HTH domain